VAVSFTLTDVAYSYRRDGPPVLRGIHLALTAGRRIALLGLSGTGKTTLLNLLGLLWEGRLPAGSIHYRDGAGRVREYQDLSSGERAALRRDEFGFVPQSPYFLPSFSSIDNIAMPLALRGLGRRERRREVERLLEQTGFGDLGPVLHRPGAEASGGQRQRLAVLRAVIHNPRVVLADEPVSNLDSWNRDLTLQLLRRWHAGQLHPGQPAERTLILVCHDPQTAWEMAEDFLFLEAEKTGVQGPSPACCRQVEPRERFPEGAEDVRRRLCSGPPSSSPQAARL
jgi:ABC-type lipoprotein export system ATPase subunit